MTQGCSVLTQEKFQLFDSESTNSCSVGPGNDTRCVVIPRYLFSVGLNRLFSEHRWAAGAIWQLNPNQQIEVAGEKAMLLTDL